MRRQLLTFSPLIGLNFNFKEVMGGNLTSTIRINSAVSYSLNQLARIFRL
ncbi:MAG: hypothetical protein IPL53_22050 [Ignavibacteria bacterium]|nr:hypothetical protein [Ignavibacteria bacterium]